MEKKIDIVPQRKIRAYKKYIFLYAFFATCTQQKRWGVERVFLYFSLINGGKMIDFVYEQQQYYIFN